MNQSTHTNEPTTNRVLLISDSTYMPFPISPRNMGTRYSLFLLSLGSLEIRLKGVGHGES